MARETLQAWAKRFVADLRIDGAAVPLDRVLRRHLTALARIRADGLTWASVADAVRQAGGRRKNGMPFTAAQFRADVSRLQRAQLSRTAKPPVQVPAAPFAVQVPAGIPAVVRPAGEQNKVRSRPVGEPNVTQKAAGSTEPTAFDLDAVRRKLDRIS